MTLIDPTPASPAGQEGQTGQAELDRIRSDPDLAIATAGLTMRFRSGQVAVDEIYLAVPPGSVYGFLGPNGSGKTTTIRMLLGLVHPTSGTFRLLGTDVHAGLDQVLPRVGALVEGPAFYPFLSARQNLARCDAADRSADPRTAAARIEAALDQVGLLAAADKRYRVYSLGMKQRLGIAAGLLQPRDLMILDEPTNGLDPQGTREIRSLIKQIAADGTTVFVSSHLLAEVEQICSHVGVMSTGRLVFQGTMTDLRSRGEPMILIRTTEPALAAGQLKTLGLADITVTDDSVTAQLGEHAPELINADLVGPAFRSLAWRRSGQAWKIFSSSSRVRASMSTASATKATAAQTHSMPRQLTEIRHWLRLFRSECRIVFLRPRNLAVLGVLAAAPVFLGIVLKINTPTPGSGGPSGAGEFIGQVAENGVFLSLLSVFVLLTLVLPLAIAVVSGDSVAGEAGLGTMRTLLTVPAGRVRLLVTKYVMIVFFCCTACLIVAGVGLAMGALLFPIGPVTLLSGDTVSLADGLGGWR